jgi:mRNA interferase RelE/StbE
LASNPYKLRMPEDLVLVIRNMHPSIKKKVRSSLAAIQSDPTRGKSLKEDLAGLRSFRTGRLRIVYKVSGQEVRIVAIGPRSRIYEETLRLIKR